MNCSLELGTFCDQAGAEKDESLPFAQTIKIVNLTDKQYGRRVLSSLRLVNGGTT